VDNLGRGERGRPLNRTSISKDFEQIFTFRTPKTPHPVHCRPDRKICWVSDEMCCVFAQYARWCLPNGRCWTGGVSKKSVFDRTSLMDDPLQILIQLIPINFNILIFCASVSRVNSEEERRQCRRGDMRGG